MRIPLEIIFLTILIQSIIDIYIWIDLYKSYHISAKKSVRCLILLQSCILIFIVAILLPRRDTDANIQPIMWLLYIYITTLFPKIIYVIFSLIGRIPTIFRKNNLKLGLYIGIPAAIVIFISMWWGSLISRKQIDINNADIYSEKLPSEFEGYKIVQFSDLHLGTFGNDTTFISKVVDSINSLKPDLIVFTGDFVNRETNEARPFINTLSKLQAKDGIYSILGNHDYGDYMDWNSPSDKMLNLNSLYHVQESINWKLLNNDYDIIRHKNDSIIIIGVENWGEPPFKQYGDLTNAYKIHRCNKLYDNNFKILLSHNPNHWSSEVINNSNIDLTLSGHTHAMQFMIKIGNWKWSPSMWKYDEWAGLYSRKNKNNDNLQLYVNIGIGEVAIPFRLGANPEITLITLRKSSK